MNKECYDLGFNSDSIPPPTCIYVKRHLPFFFAKRKYCIINEVIHVVNGEKNSANR